MKCRITLVICIFCILCICTSCSDAAPVSTSGQINNTEHTSKYTEPVIVPAASYVKGTPDYYKIIEKNIAVTGQDFIIKHTDYNFINWICHTYDSDFAIGLSDALTSGSYTDSFWHKRTGYSFHVLWDSYNHVSYHPENGTYSKNAANTDYVTMTFAGDLCLSEGWYTLSKYDEVNGDLSQCISNDLTERLKSSDIFMLNNEFTFSDRGSPLNGKYYTFRASPNRITILKSLGVDVVSVANNHIFDFGSESFFDTLSTLAENGIPYFGGGKDIGEACRPVYFVINGIKIGFVGASRAEKIRYTPGAGSDSPGVLLTYDNTEYLKAIEKAKENCDYLVAYVHWGTEDSHNVTDYQQTMGHQFIDAGADIVVGGHPHVLQGIEYYNEKPILYSLGDFWFNYETKETGAIEIQIDASGLKSMKFLPCMQENYTTSLKTDPVQSRKIYDFLQSLSDNIIIDDNGYIKKELPSNP